MTNLSQLYIVSLANRIECQGKISPKINAEQNLFETQTSLEVILPLRPTFLVAVGFVFWCTMFLNSNIIQY